MTTIVVNWLHNGWWLVSDPFPAYFIPLQSSSQNWEKQFEGSEKREKILSETYCQLHCKNINIIRREETRGDSVPVDHIH